MTGECEVREVLQSLQSQITIIMQQKITIPVTKTECEKITLSIEFIEEVKRIARRSYCKSDL